MKRLLAWAIALPLASCAVAPAQGNGQVLHLALQDTPSTLDPALASNVPAIGTSHWLFNGLVGFDPKGRVVPDLASRVTVDRTGRHYVFTLRNGVHFHDGRLLTSADVRYSLTRLLRPETKSPGASFFRAIQGAPDVLEGRAKEASGIQAPRPEVVELTLSAPEPTFLERLALNYAAILPVGAGDRPDFAQHPIGTGPFRLKSLRRGVRMAFERNPAYFKPGLPRLSGIDVALGLNEQVEAFRFELGEIDAIGLFKAIGAADFVRLRRDGRWKERFLSSPDAATYYVGMNTRMAPFSDVRVRRAVAMAIDKDRLVRLVNGRGEPARSFLPSILPGADPHVSGWNRDPAKARALLAQAGYPHGLDTTYWCSNSQTTLKVAQSIQQDLAAVGIRATLKPLAFSTFLTAVSQPGQVPIFSGNWSMDYPDPANFLATLFSSRSIHPVHSVNTTYFTDRSVDAWLDEAEARQGDAARFALYRQVEARMLDQSPVVPLYHPVRYVLAQGWVKGLALHAVWPLDAETVRLER
jgi:ABC-type transport system substrate-binding protein